MVPSGFQATLVMLCSQGLLLYSKRPKASHTCAVPRHLRWVEFGRPCLRPGCRGQHTAAGMLNSSVLVNMQACCAWVHSSSCAHVCSVAKSNHLIPSVFTSRDNEPSDGIPVCLQHHPLIMRFPADLSSATVAAAFAAAPHSCGPTTGQALQGSDADSAATAKQQLVCCVTTPSQAAYRVVCLHQH